MFLQIGCASTNYRHAEHSVAEVEMEQRRAEETALAAMANSSDLEVAQTARRMSNGGDTNATEAAPLPGNGASGGGLAP